MRKQSLCAVIMGKKMDELIRQALLVEKEVDLVEMRIDFLESKKYIDLQALKKAIKKNTIITCRRKDEGGKWIGSESSRLALLSKAFNMGFSFVDVELRTLEEGVFIVPQNMKMNGIISFHNFIKTPRLAQIKRILERMQRFNPAVKKIAAMVKDESDNAILIQAVLDAKKEEQVCIIGMGEYGKKTRIIAPLLSGSFAYCSINGEGSAPGQMSCHEMREIYKLLS